MRELDDLLLRYVEGRFANAPEREKAAFHALLQLPDPELVGYLLNRRQPEDKDIADVVSHILC
jgi:succinate dehydrogenase flavin-adding protein (antitoxin of CptAB toxin-antitoxin module)